MALMRWLSGNESMDILYPFFVGSKSECDGPGLDDQH